jgi:hypothetical protein
MDVTRSKRQDFGWRRTGDDRSQDLGVSVKLTKLEEAEPERCVNCLGWELLDHHLALHAFLFMAVNRAVHLVGAGFLEAHREHAALSRI